VTHCKICGAIAGSTLEHPAEQPHLLYTGPDYCFHCKFWTDQFREDKQNAETVVIVAHKHYMVGPDADNAGFRGHNGTRFDIKFMDGRRTITRDLWCQGTVPPRFHDFFPDNAAFVAAGA
jgi:hypothetical protein